MSREDRERAEQPRPRKELSQDELAGVVGGTGSGKSRGDELTEEEMEKASGG